MENSIHNVQSKKLLWFWAMGVLCSFILSLPLPPPTRSKCMFEIQLKIKLKFSPLSNINLADKNKITQKQKSYFYSTNPNMPLVRSSRGIRECSLDGFFKVQFWEIRNGTYKAGRGWVTSKVCDFEKVCKLWL